MVWRLQVAALGETEQLRLIEWSSRDLRWKLSVSSLDERPCPFLPTKYGARVDQRPNKKADQAAGQKFGGLKMSWENYNKGVFERFQQH
jgi:hypothetical protein